MPRYWLIVERYENWLVDSAEGFRHFGLSERRKAAIERIKAGDLLIVYVTGKSCFSDVRRVLMPTTVRLKLGGPYDAAFPYALATEPVVTLKAENWLSVQSLAPKLGFLQFRDWRQAMRNSLREIPESDGRLLEKAIRSAAAHSN